MHEHRRRELIADLSLLLLCSLLFQDAIGINNTTLKANLNPAKASIPPTYSSCQYHIHFHSLGLALRMEIAEVVLIKQGR